LNTVVARAADYYGARGASAPGLSEEDLSQTLDSQLEVAEILRIQGDAVRARALFEQARDLAESQIARKSPHERELVRAYIGLSDIRSTEGRPIEAISNLLKAREVLSGFVSSEAYGGDLAAELVLLHQKMGEVNQTGGNLPSAASEYSQALEIAREESAKNKDSHVWQSRVASSLLGLGSAYEWQGQLDKALGLFAEATTILESIHTQNPENIASGSALCLAYSALGDRLKGNGRVPDAREIFTKQLELAEGLSASDPADVSLQELISLSHVQLGDTYRDEWLGPEAMAAFERALEIDERLAALLPDSPSRRALLARDKMRLGTAATISLGRTVAIAYLKDALTDYNALIETNPANPSWRRSAATAPYKCVSSWSKRGASLRRSPRQKERRASTRFWLGATHLMPSGCSNGRTR
jgi:tetratricopeptide (TPR) repeat protein